MKLELYLDDLVAEMSQKTLSTTRRIEAIRHILNGNTPQFTFLRVDQCLLTLLSTFLKGTDDNYYYLLQDTLTFIKTGHRPLPLTIRFSLFAVDGLESGVGAPTRPPVSSSFNHLEKSRMAKEVNETLGSYRHEELLYQWLVQPNGFKDFVTFMQLWLKL